MIFNGGLVVLAIGMLAILLLRIRRSRGLERLDIVPAVMAAAAIAVFGVLYLGTRILGLPDDLQDAFRISTAVAALATPVSFLAVVVRRQVLRSAAADFLPRIYYGAQQVLLTARLRLAMATRAAGPSTVQAIDRARADVDAALEVIRDVAAGEHSPLAGRELADALVGLTRDAGLPVALRVNAGQLSAVLERTVWYLVSEGITNIRKHAGASAAGVVIKRDGRDVIIRIEDDGRGGPTAPVAPGCRGWPPARTRTVGGSMWSARSAREPPSW